jgi:hypothetical protein
MEQKEQLYTPNDVAQMGIMSLVMQWQERKSGRLPHYRIGRKILYAQKHLDSYFASCERGVESESERDVA